MTKHRVSILARHKREPRPPEPPRPAKPAPEVPAAPAQKLEPVMQAKEVKPFEPPHIVTPALQTVTGAVRYVPASYPTSFLGLMMTQVWDDLILWERFFNEHQVRGVCELGTGDGGMAVYLALQCAQRGAALLTIDHHRFLDTSRGVPALLGMGTACACADLWGAGGAQVRAFLARPDVHPVMLWCDDGDKPREWQTFGPLLRAGDFLAVHDWGVEFREADTAGVRVQPLMAAECAAQGAITRWFEVLGGTA